MATAYEDKVLNSEDQLKINRFARENTLLIGLKDALLNKEKELEDLKYAEEEFLMGEEDGTRIPYQIGGILVDITLEEAQVKLAEAKETCQADIVNLMQQAETHKQSLNELKATLCSKFGRNISLILEDQN